MTMVRGQIRIKLTQGNTPYEYFYSNMTNMAHNNWTCTCLTLSTKKNRIKYRDQRTITVSKANSQCTPIQCGQSKRDSQDGRGEGEEKRNGLWLILTLPDEWVCLKCRLSATAQLKESGTATFQNISRPSLYIHAFMCKCNMHLSHHRKKLIVSENVVIDTFVVLLK